MHDFTKKKEGEKRKMNLQKFPKCPKCKNDLVPLSEPREDYGVRDYCLLYAKWKCVKCKFEIKYD